MDIIAYALAKGYTKKAINDLTKSLGTPLVFKGTVALKTDLPTTGNKIGEIYHVVENKNEYIWMDDNGAQRWEDIGPIMTGVPKPIAATSEMTEDVGITDDGKLKTKPYTLPKASNSTLGGVIAEEKTAEDSQEVKIDMTSGKLFIKPTDLSNCVIKTTNGTTGDFAISDGNGGITWRTISNGNEVSY